MGRPAYLRIRAELEQRIRSGALPPGSRLPTEAEIQQVHSVGRATAQRVLSELAQAGLVERYRRHGTFVARGGRQANLLRHIDPGSAGPELAGRHAVESATVVPARDLEMELPGLDDEEPVHVLRRLKYDVDDNPVVVETTVVPFRLAPRLHEEDLAHLTVHDYFVRTGVPASTARVYLDPILLDEDTARRLQVTDGQPVIRLRRMTWLDDGALAEVSWLIVGPNQLEFYIEQSPPPVTTQF